MKEKILVIGAKGMLGRDLCPLLAKAGGKVIAVDIDDLDITKKKETALFIRQTKPDIIINCAGYTLVDMAEKEYQKAFQINAEGVRNIAEPCREHGILLIHMSTDYVFDGLKVKAKMPEDPLTPINLYGYSKAKGEQILMETCRNYYLIRTSSLFGKHGRNFVNAMLEMGRTVPEVSVISDQVSCPTWTVDLSKAIVQIVKDRPPFGIYHLCGQDPVSWYDLAREIFRLSGLKPHLVPVEAANLPRPARRPTYSVLEQSGPYQLRSWKEALKEYLKVNK